MKQQKKKIAPKKPNLVLDIIIPLAVKAEAMKYALATAETTAKLSPAPTEGIPPKITLKMALDEVKPKNEKETIELLSFGSGFRIEDDVRKYTGEDKKQLIDTYLTVEHIATQEDKTDVQSIAQIAGYYTTAYTQEMKNEIIKQSKLSSFHITYEFLKKIKTSDEILELLEELAKAYNKTPKSDKYTRAMFELAHQELNNQLFLLSTEDTKENHTASIQRYANACSAITTIRELFQKSMAGFKHQEADTDAPKPEEETVEEKKKNELTPMQRFYLREGYRKLLKKGKALTPSCTALALELEDLAYLQKESKTFAYSFKQFFFYACSFFYTETYKEGQKQVSELEKAVLIVLENISPAAKEKFEKEEKAIDGLDKTAT